MARRRAQTRRKAEKARPAGSAGNGARTGIQLMRAQPARNPVIPRRPAMSPPRPGQPEATPGQAREPTETAPGRRHGARRRQS